MWRGLIDALPDDFWTNEGTDEDVRQINCFIEKPDYHPRVTAELLMEAFYNDAFSSEPETGDLRVICDASRPPIAVSKLANANVGSLPAPHAYLSVHKKHGTKLWHVAHGLKHGANKTLLDLEAESRPAEAPPASQASAPLAEQQPPPAKKPASRRKPKPDKFGAGQMYEGCQTWIDGQPEDVRREIKHHLYFNSSGCIAEWDKRHATDNVPKLAQLLDKLPFTYLGFLVRHEIQRCMTQSHRTL